MVMSEGDEGDVRDGGGGQHRMMQSNAMEWCMYAGGGGGGACVCEECSARLAACPWVTSPHNVQNRIDSLFDHTARAVLPLCLPPRSSASARLAAASLSRPSRDVLGAGALKKCFSLFTTNKPPCSSCCSSPLCPPSSIEASTGTTVASVWQEPSQPGLLRWTSLITCDSTGLVWTQFHTQVSAMQVYMDTIRSEASNTPHPGSSLGPGQPTPGPGPHVRVWVGS